MRACSTRARKNFCLNSFIRNKIFIFEISNFKKKDLIYLLDIKNVFDDFLSLSGLSTEEANKHKNLVKIATDYVLFNLKPGVDITANKNLLSMLAASIAYHKYVLIQESLANNSSIKLGEISINSNSSSMIKSAEKLKKEFISLSSHLLLLPNFIFKQI